MPALGHNAIYGELPAISSAALSCPGLNILSYLSLWYLVIVSPHGTGVLLAPFFPCDNQNWLLLVGVQQLQFKMFDREKTFCSLRAKEWPSTSAWMHVLDAVFLPSPQQFPTSQSKGLKEEGGSPVNVVLTLTIISVSAASDNSKGYCCRGISLPSFVMDLLFRLPRETLSSLCLPQSLSHITTRNCFMENRQYPSCAGGLGVFVWVSAFIWGKEKENRKLSQNFAGFTSVTSPGK